MFMISGYNNRMEFFLNDPNVPRLPPEKTRFVNLKAELNQDRNFFRVTLELTPFQQSPDIEIKLLDRSGAEISFLH